MKEDILKSVQNYIASEGLFPPGTPLLVACSGGVDSMAAVEILRYLNYPVGIAHCNFRLRGDRSDGDEQFVKDYASDLDLPFFSTSFDTSAYSTEHGLSIQEAARDLRYTWLEETRKKNGFHFIVMAHHLDDNVETVLYNMIKNTGIRGLRGILPKRDKIVRPLLSLTKKDILGFASNINLDHREDETNVSTKYSRNYIRHKVMPVLETLNPEAANAIDMLSHKAEEAEVLMSERMQQIKRKILTDRYNAKELKFRYLLNHPAGKTILFNILSVYGYNEEQVNGVYNDLRKGPGIEFFSSTHRILKDRNSLFITPLESQREWIRRFETLPAKIHFNNYKISLDVVPINKVSIKRSSEMAYLDKSKIKLPLTIRYWKSGDYFYPYGLTKRHSDKPGKKKLSKFFKDEKVPVYEKETTPVIFSAEKLIWLVGYRIDHRFCVTDETREVLKIKIIKS